MEKTGEIKELYERILEQITLYNQYKNNINFEKAKKLSELLMNINNLAVKLGVYMGDAELQLVEMEGQLKSKDKTRSIVFV